MKLRAFSFLFLQRDFFQRPIKSYYLLSSNLSMDRVQVFLLCFGKGLNQHPPLSKQLSYHTYQTGKFEYKGKVQIDWKQLFGTEGRPLTDMLHLHYPLNFVLCFKQHTYRQFIRWNQKLSHSSEPIPNDQPRQLANNLTPLSGR